MAAVQSHRVEKRPGEVELVRDPRTKLLVVRWGADRGTPERRLREGGIVLASDKVAAVLGPAYAAIPGPLELLVRAGCLGEGEQLRRRLDAARTLRLVASQAGVRRRTTGRYEIGFQGRGEMSGGAVRAFYQVSRLAERMGWPMLGILLDVVLTETARLPAPPGPCQDPKADHPFEAAARAALERHWRSVMAPFAAFGAPFDVVYRALDVARLTAEG